MASDYYKLKEQLETELSKSAPDSDIVYALQNTIPYANVIDNDKIRRGFEKLEDSSNARQAKS